MNFLVQIKKHIKATLLKTFLVTILFVFVYQIYNIEIIRSSIEDRAFDIVNMLYLNESNHDSVSPPVNILKIDKYVLAENQFLNEDNFTNYGYLYPRDKIAKIIEKFNHLEPDKQPTSLFIDFDFTFSSLPYGKDLSQEDKLFIRALKQDRSYVILLPKISEFNFIEKSEDADIQKQIDSKKLKFVSVAFTVSKDGYSRRYLPYQIYEGKKYWNAPITLWQLGREANDTSVLESFHQKDIIDNRIIYKEYEESTIDIKQNGYLSQREKSYWKQLESYSLNYPYEQINLKDSIVLLGTDHVESNDFFTVYSASSSKMSGVEMHANALMTLLKNDGPLKRVSLLYSVLIIFMLFLFVDMILELFFERLNIASEEIIFMISLLISSVFLLSISIMTLKVFNLWFNWLIPFIIFEVFEIIEILLYYYHKSMKKKKKATV